MNLRAVIWCAVSTAPQAGEDKDSLITQERLAVERCETEGWSIVAILRVPGHSRYYIDIHECAHDMASQGITAFNDLIDLWDKKAFDVLVVRDGDRFARTQTLHSYVVEKTISIGARIYSFHDGWIDERQASMFIAMSGYKTAHDISRIVEYGKMGKKRRVSGGLPVGKPPLSHVVIRDQSGHAVRMVVDETKRRMLNDLADLILEGVAWNNIESELARRFAHHRYATTTLYTVVYNPNFWGHSAQGFARKSLRGSWVYDEDEEPPNGVVVYRNTHQPVYVGDLAERIKAELRRRESIRGKSSPNKSYKFSGVLMCDECGWNFTIRTPGRKKGKNYIYYSCASRYAHYTCTQTHGLSETKVLRYVNSYLTELQKRIAEGDQPFADEPYDRIGPIKGEIAVVEAKLNGLIRDKAEAPTSAVQIMYTQQIMAASEQLVLLQAQLRLAMSKMESPSVVQGRQLAFLELQAMQLETFWQQPNLYINQTLRRIMGKRRFVVRDGIIIGVKTRD